MIRTSFLSITLAVIAISLVCSSPINKRDLELCTGNDLFTYAQGKEYVYEYSTKTTLWINDVSDEAKSDIELKARAIIQRAQGPCQYQLRLESVVISGETVSDSRGVGDELTRNVVVFSIDTNGALSSDIKFSGDEKAWSKNVKRGIISAFQLRSDKELRVVDPFNVIDPLTEKKSSVVYETDNLGKCRTTYEFQRTSPNTISIVKRKSMHRCTLNEYTTSSVQYVNYKNLPEWYNGQSFVESYKCNIVLQSGLLNDVTCTQKSTFKVGSRGTSGAQAIGESILKLKGEQSAKPLVALNRAAPSSLVHEYDLSSSLESGKNFDLELFTKQMCDQLENDGLSAQHTQSFKELVLSFKSKSKADLLKAHTTAAGKCNLAGQTVLQAIFYTETDNSVDASLDLLDRDLLKEAVLVTEYPILTALARNRNPSAKLLNSLKAYLIKKDETFAYTKKLYLVFSSLTQTHCSVNTCSQEDLNNWTDFLLANLGSNCGDAKRSDLVLHSLKAIGNIGYARSVKALGECALRKQNTLETRTNALEALRRFKCDQVENIESTYVILKDSEDDAEVRIVAFGALVKCIHSARFEKFASDELAKFLLAENDIQVTSYIIDFAKERGVTLLLNPILSYPEIRQKLQINFKETSWNNYRYTYNVERDAALEVDTSVVYASKSFVPRNINFNLTLHTFGLSVNAIDATIRLEGLDELLKGYFIDKLTSEKLLARLTEKPEQLLAILQQLAAKLQYSQEKPYVSISLRVYGSDVFYSNLDSAEKIIQAFRLFKSFSLQRLFAETNRIRNVFLLNTNVQKAMLNGLEFETNFDATFGSYRFREGDLAREEQTKFNFRYLYSASLLLTTSFKVQLNERARLALQKQSELATNVELSVDGERNGETFVYNVNLDPKAEKVLFKYEGQFSKLSKNGKYSKVTQFKTEQVTKEICTSQNFHENVGVDVCFTVARPQFKRLRDLLNRQNQIDFDEDDEDDEDFQVETPSILLRGPYKYELKLINTEKINKFVISGKWTRAGEHNVGLQVSLQSNSATHAPRQLELNYKRFRTITSRTQNRGISVELKVPKTDDVRLKFDGEFNYKKDALIDFKLAFDNKVLREVYFDLGLKREETPENLLPNYHIYSNAKTSRGVSQLKLDFVEDAEKNINSDLLVEFRGVKVLEAKLIADRNAEYDFGYDVNFSSHNYKRQRSISLNGKLGLGLIASNIDLIGNYSSPTRTFERPIHIRSAHGYNFEGESYALLDIELPRESVSHGFKLTFENAATKKFVQLEVNTPKSKAADAPYTIYVSQKLTSTDRVTSFGFKNVNIDLSRGLTATGRLLKKVDGDETLRSFSVQTTRSIDESENLSDYTLEVKKNGDSFVSLHTYLHGNTAKLLSQQIPIDETYKSGIEFEVVEYKGSIKGEIQVTKANANSKKYQAHIWTSDLITTLLKTSDITGTFSVNGDNVDLKYNSIKEGLEYTSVDVVSKGKLKRNAAGDKEFEIVYTKKFPSGPQTTTGTISYVYERSQGKLNAKFGLVLNGGEERLYKLNIDRAGGVKKFDLSAKAGTIGGLADKSKIRYSIELSGSITPGERFFDLLKIYSRTYNIDLTSSTEVSVSQSIVNYTGKTDAKFPAFLTQPGEINFVKRNAQIQIPLDFSTATATFNYETNNRLFARRYTLMDLTYKHGFEASKIVASVNANYKKSSDPKQELKNFKLNVDAEPCGETCVKVNLNINQQITEVFQECANSIRVSVQRGQELNAEASLLANCAGLKVTDTRVKVQRSALKRHYELLTESDIYEPKKFLLAFVPFSKTSGNATVHVYLDEQAKFENTFAYTRELDAQSKQLKKSNYKFTSNIGSAYKKVCTLFVDRTQDRVTNFNCDLVTPESKQKLNYGFKVLVKNPSKWNFGQRNLVAEVSLLSGRVIKLDWKSNRATPFDGTDDDSDPNDEREFNGTCTINFDLKRDPKKSLTLTFKRDNIAPGKFNFFVEIGQHPIIKSARIEFSDYRLNDVTQLKLGLSYELTPNNAKNRLDLEARLTSDLETSQFSLEGTLQKPQFNVFYENKFNKLNGRLAQLKLRVAKLLQLVVDKEYDADNRRISLEFFNRDQKRYQLTSSPTFENGIYTVSGELKQGGKSLATITSSFNTLNTNLNVQISASQSAYGLDFGLYNESLANGVIKSGDVYVAALDARFVPLVINENIRLNDLVINLKWNKFWSKLQREILGETAVQSAKEQDEFNSYFGDTYSQIIEDVQPLVEYLRAQRAQFRQESLRSLQIHADYFSQYNPRVKECFESYATPAANNKMAPEPYVPIAVRLFKRYDKLADYLDDLLVRVLNSRFRRLAGLIPRLTRVSYNEDLNAGGRKDFAKWENNLVLKRKLLKSNNFYQFNAQFRDRVKRIGDLILRLKGALVRELNIISLRGFFNEYKYRSISNEYTIVGTVFNRRNIIGYDGDSTILQSRCKYLLAHDTAKNKFSIVLNFDNSPSSLTVYVGKNTIQLDSGKVTINNEKTSSALPRVLDLAGERDVYVGRVTNGICLSIKAEFKVCCYEDSNSCTLALTRWYTGKVNGLFGRADNFGETLDGKSWTVGTCPLSAERLITPNEVAIQKCFSLFGKHRRSQYRDALMAVQTDGWRKVCEIVATANPNALCQLQRAFIESTRAQSILLKNMPEECYKCNNKQAIGESFTEAIKASNDYVFVSLACNSKEFGFNYDNLLRQLKAKDPKASNNYYVVKVDGDETSIFQTSDGKFSNFDMKQALGSLKRDATLQTDQQTFLEALFYAESLFARRTALKRNLIVLSCGNCPSLRYLQTLRLARKLKQRNIVVSSWGAYNMNVDDPSTDQGKVIGYDNEEIHFLQGKNLDSDNLDSYFVDHQADTCERLARRTSGSVIDVRSLQNTAVLSKLPEIFEKNVADHSFTGGKCELVNKYYGTYADFKFKVGGDDSN